MSPIHNKALNPIAAVNEPAQSNVSTPSADSQKGQKAALDTAFDQAAANFAQVKVAVQGGHHEQGAQNHELTAVDLAFQPIDIVHKESKTMSLDDWTK